MGASVIHPLSHETLHVYTHVQAWRGVLDPTTQARWIAIVARWNSRARLVEYKHILSYPQTLPRVPPLDSYLKGKVRYADLG